MPVIPRTFTGHTSDYLTYHAGPGAPSVADLPTAGSAMVWHDTALDEIQVWANVAGTLKKLPSGGGGGVSGTGVAGQVAYWTGSTSIGGDSGLTYASGTLTVGTKVQVGDGATGAPSFTWTGAPQMGFFRQPAGVTGAEAFRITFDNNQDRIEFWFQPGGTIFPQRPPTWITLGAQTDIRWDGNGNLPATSPISTATSYIAITSFIQNVFDIHNYGSGTSYTDTRIRLNRRGIDIFGSDAFLELGFTSTLSTNSSAQLRIVNVGATSMDFNFIIPSVTSGSRYLFTIGSTSLLTIRQDGGHEINGSGSPNKTGICVVNSGGPPTGRVALATFASVNGVQNICRYGVLFSESALNSGCQFKRRTSAAGLQPVLADLPEEGEWALWKTTTDGLHSIVVRDLGALVYVGGRRRVAQSADITTNSATPVSTNLTVNLLGGFYYIRAVCHILAAAGSGVFGVPFFRIGLSGTAAGTMRISVIRISNINPNYVGNNTANRVTTLTGFGTATFESDVTVSNSQVVLFEGTFGVSTPGSFTVVFGGDGVTNQTFRMHSYLEISR